jgi:hypothetical protein
MIRATVDWVGLAVGAVLWLIGIAIQLAVWLIPRERVIAWGRSWLARFRRPEHAQATRPLFVPIDGATEVDIAHPMTVRLTTEGGTAIAGGASAVLSTPALIRGTAHAQSRASAVLTAPSVIRGTA